MLFPPDDRSLFSAMSASVKNFVARVATSFRTPVAASRILRWWVAYQADERFMLR